MKQSTPILIFQFILLVLLQVLVLDNVLLFGFINPYIYILYIILLPNDTSRLSTILVSFLLGLSIDIFNDSGGIHAASCLVIAYFRPFIFSISFGLNYDLSALNITALKFQSQLTYIILIVFLHHLVLFSLQYFNINFVGEIVLNTLYSGIFTSLITVFIIRLFKSK